jgi:hypothetical protein
MLEIAGASNDAMRWMPSNHRFFGGSRGDPFSFQPAGAVNHLQFTGTEFFAYKDVRNIPSPTMFLVTSFPFSRIGVILSPLHRAVGRWLL